MSSKISGTKSVTKPTVRLRKLVKMAVLLLLLFGAEEVRGQSALDGFDPNADGKVHVVVVQPDGKIFIGGEFTTVLGVARNNIARLNTDGTLDITFNPDANGAVFSIVMQTNSTVLVGGDFHTIGGQMRSCLARLDATTGLADSFDPNPNNSVRAIAIQTDGKILVGGAFESIGGQPRHYLARLDATTGAADSFDSNASGASVSSIAIQADGKILTAGLFEAIGGQPRNYIARLDATTGLADSFNPNANGFVLSIAIQTDGKILAGGAFTNIGGQPHNHMARLDATTGLADSFNPNANGWVLSIATQTDGKILVGGNFSGIGGQSRSRFARLDAATGLSDSFDPGASDLVSSIAVQADGKILAGGQFTTLMPNGGPSVTRNHIARFETDGRLDQTLNLGLSDGDTIVTSAVQPDGKILIGGSFTTILGVARNNMARLNPDGSLDAAFNPNANIVVYSIAVQADGRILVGGPFTSIGGQTRNYIARLDPTSGLADSFDPNADSVINAIAVQADGKILVGGSFNNVGGQARSYIARLDATTGLADQFAPNANNAVWTIAVKADGKILAGGNFTNIGGQTRHSIAQLDATTGFADSFDPSANGLVIAIALQADGAILAGGSFDTIGGQTRHNIARLDATTGLADSFDPNANGYVFSIAVQADGKILAGGDFHGVSGIGGQMRNYIARLDATTGLADSFDPNADHSVSSIVVQDDGKILASSGFFNIGGQPRRHFARLSNDTAALQKLAATQTTVTWTRSGSSPQFTRVTFDYSTDNVNYTSLGDGAAAGSNWILTGLNLPIRHNIYIRARGHRPIGNQNGSQCFTESVRNAFLAPSTLGNISTRLRVQTGDNAMIGGFIITGTEPKTVIVRGIGPSLPVPGALADPVIEIHGSAGELLASNDNWMTDPNQQHVIDHGLTPASNLESALWRTLNPGTYTVIVRGANEAAGIGLFEVYDVDQTVDSQLANISTRGFVEAGDNVIVGGIIIVGTTPTSVLFRAIGPSLTNSGVSNALPDPTLELRDANGGLIAANDNWRTEQEAEIIATGIPPSNDLESAIRRDLTPGNYTAIVRGMNDTTGTAVVETYDLN